MDSLKWFVNMNIDLRIRNAKLDAECALLEKKMQETQAKSEHFIDQQTKEVAFKMAAFEVETKEKYREIFKRQNAVLRNLLRRNKELSKK